MNIGKYTKKIDIEFVRELPNQGRNSYVFIGKDPQLDSELVYKRIKRENFNGDEYFKEARLIYKNYHQYVVRINYACYDDDYIYIGMPFYKNGSIKELITNGHFLTPKEVIRYSIQFLTGLNGIHSKRYIHFDIKPDNILISDSNEALISDFGLTKQMINGIARPDSIYKQHITPEIIMNVDCDIRHDIYQSGLTMYRMLNGFDSIIKQKEIATNNNVLVGKFPDKTCYLPHISLSLRKVVNKCLNPNPNDRYQNTLDLINALSNIESTESLNWRYSIDGSTEQWVKSREDGYIFSIVVEEKGKCYDIQAIKGNGIKKQRILKHCYTNIDSSEKRKRLKEALEVI